MQTLERIKRQWQFAVDSMPQLICLVDREGRIIRSNRTVERWKLGSVESVNGLFLHDVLHKHCSDPACYLKSMPEHAGPMLAEHGQAQHSAWDPILERHLVIRTQMPIRTPDAGGTPEDFFAVVTIDDVSNWRASEEQSKQATHVLNERVHREMEMRVEAEKVQSRLRTLLDRTPNLIAMANDTGALFYLNPAGRALLHVESDQDIADLTLTSCHAPAMRDCLGNEAIPTALRDGVWTGDSVLLTSDGREVKAFLTVIAHHDRNGQLDGFSLLERDMSEWMRIGEALRVSQIQLRRLAAQHLNIQETERRRIAADLHDGLGPSLSLLKLSVEEAAKWMSAGATDKAAASLGRLTPRVKCALDEVRRIAMNLRPSILDDLGILATLSWFLREFEASCTKVRIERNISVAESDVPRPIKIAIFRILQEATNNAVKHANASRITVSLRHSDETIELAIQDDGQGYDPAGVSTAGGIGKGLGLQSMQERAELSGGTYEIQSAPGKGTRIRACWPSVKGLERAVDALPRRTVLAVRNVTSDDPEVAQHMAKATQTQVDSFLFCAACHRRST